MANLHYLCNCLFYVVISCVTASCRTTGFCNPFTTCRQGKSTRCKCDSLCNFYKDCCIDIYRPGDKLYVHAGTKFSCLPLIPNENIYAIDRCLNSWTGPVSVREKCESFKDITDPLMSAPVTDTETSITYRSRYCAACNGANSDRLWSWFVNLACNSLLRVQFEYQNITQHFILHNITRVGNAWGVYHWNNSRGSTSFFQCDLSFLLPSNLSHYARNCYFDIVSECASDWVDEQTRKLCESYMSVVFDVNNRAYRNIHCVVCNYIPMNNFKCYTEGGYMGVAADYIPEGGIVQPPLNFAILLDVNPTDGSKVGLKSSCLSDQIFDPFTKKCRSLVCAVPGFVRKNNKCIQQ